MTEHSTSRDHYQRAWDDAVDALTRLARPAPAQPGEPGADRRPSWADDAVDLAGPVAGILAAVAANLGGSDRLTAGRPGSWEAGLVQQLVAGTVGHDDECLWRHRTEPVVVRLNVLDLPYEVDRFPNVDLALGDVDERYDGGDGSELDTDLDAYTAELDTVLAAYRDLYRDYAAAFTAEVSKAAAATPGLKVQVRVEALHDPSDPTHTAGTGADGLQVRNAFDIDGPDALAAQLWRTAYAAVPTPTPPTAGAVDRPDTDAP